MKYSFDYQFGVIFGVVVLASFVVIVLFAADTLYMWAHDCRPQDAKCGIFPIELG